MKTQLICHEEFISTTRFVQIVSSDDKQIHWPNLAIPRKEPLS